MSELVLLSASDETALVAEIDRLVGFLERAPDVSLVDVAYTCSLEVRDCVLSIVAKDISDLHARLVSARGRLAAGNVQRLRDKAGTYYFRDHLLGKDKGKLAFVYPGVMAFYPDMLRDLAIAIPECRSAFDELEEALAGDSEFTPSSFIFPPAAYYRHDADIFKSGAYAQALVSTYAACVALTRLLQRGGIMPDGVVGFAGGDLAAMMRSGAAGEKLSRPDRVKVVGDIYRVVHKAVNNGGLEEVVMLTVLLRHPDELAAVISSFPKDKVILAVDFSPRQKTYAVAKDFADDAMRAFSAAGIRAMKLALDRPFNTPMCESLVPAIRKFVSGWMKHEPLCDVYSCATAERLPSRVRAAREDTAVRWAKPVRFEETIRQMYADGYRVFLEVGPRGLMTAAVSDTLRGEDHAAIALNSIHRTGMLQLRHAVGQLMALGARMDIARLLRARAARRLDFDSSISPEIARVSQMRLSRAFPRLSLISGDVSLSTPSVMGVPKGRGARAAARAAVVAQQHARRQRQFDFGAMNPLVSDADIVESSDGVSLEITKAFRLSELPFIGDYALGTSQMSYTDPNLKGLIPLAIPVGAEIMAEVASQVVRNLTLLRIESLSCQKRVTFESSDLRLFIRAERVFSDNPSEVAIKVRIRDDSPDSAYTVPVMEAVMVFGPELPPEEPSMVKPLTHPRGVHWSGRDIYPARLCSGSRLRGIAFVENWGEEGLDYEVEVPEQAGNLAFTRFPLWMINPLLLEIVANGFPLWRSHERFSGAFSFPFRMRRLTLFGRIPDEGASLKCYMRYEDVSPTSQLCNITVTDGNGKKIMEICGWEELTERVPSEYSDLIHKPAVSFLTAPMSDELLGIPGADFTSSFITDVPYSIFERNGGLWLQMMSHVVLDTAERAEFAEMTGSVSRRTEWLFGRVAAKEAVRRFLRDFYQSRWSDADIRIWPDQLGKPKAIGRWSDILSAKLDIAIAHTSQFVAAIAASNARVGVDVEALTRNLSDEFSDGVLTPEESELTAQSPNAQHTVIKFWCAKEAVSKALGTGIRFSPKEMIVTDYNADSGALTVNLRGGWAEAFKSLANFNIVVTVKTFRSHAIASCFIPASKFDD